MKDETFIGLRTGYWFRNLTDSLCRQAGFTPNTMLEVDEADAVVLLLRKGLGIMFAPELAWQKRAHLMPHRLRITDPGCTVTTGIAWSRKHYLSLAAERLRQFIIAYFQNINA